MLMRKSSIVVMGMTAILLQIAALRQFMAVFSGNELDIGITFSVWLAAVGAGSYTGRRIRRKNAFPFSLLAVALLAQPTLFAIRLIRPLLLSAGYYEVLSLPVTILATLMTLFPLCFLIGVQFPLAVSYFDGGSADVYSLEAAGSFLGGALFTLLLAGRAGASVMTAGIGMVNIAMAAMLFRSRWVAVLLLVPLSLYMGYGRAGEMAALQGADLVQRAESRYGEIDVLKIRDQFSLYASGKLQFSYPDIQHEEMKAHVPMTLHSLPRRILLVGGSPAVLRELLKYPVEAVDFVDRDPAVVHISLGLLDGRDRAALSDPRVRVIASDARRFVKQSAPSQYDLIIVNLPEPATADINRFYTVEFFREAERAMRTAGVLALSLPSSFGYVGRQMQLADSAVFGSLRSVFSHVALSTEEYGIFVASQGLISTDPAILKDRFSKRSIETASFHPALLDDLFSPIKVRLFTSRLSEVHAVNTDARPAAYFYNLMVWAEMQGGGILLSLLQSGTAFSLAALLLVAGPAVLFWRKTGSVAFSFFLTGYTAMAVQIILLLAYQAAFGAVYEMIGLLTAVFMAGLAVGASGLRKAGRPLPNMILLQAGTALLLAVSPLFLGYEGSYFVLNFLIGAAAGGEFSSAGRFLGVFEPAGSSGKLYAVELLGSFLGALLTAIIVVPLFGIRMTILFVVLLKAVSLATLFSIGHEKS